MAVLVGYDTTTSSLSFKIKEDRFPMPSGKQDSSYIPDPIVDSGAFNSNLSITSTSPGFVNVDWGDGQVDQFPFVKIRNSNTYRVIFRSLDIEWRKNPSATTWWFLKDDGSQYIPIPYHRYDDSQERMITMKFTNKVDVDLNFDGIFLYEWPVMDMPDLRSLKAVRARVDNGDIPFDRIGRSVNISEIQFGSLSHRGIWSNWPEGLLRLKDLRIFGCNSVFDFMADPDSNWREMSVWAKLTSFNFNWNNIPKYVPYFNDIPATDIGIISNRNDIPVMDEVDKVGDDKIAFNFMSDGSSWKQDLVGGKLNKIQRTYVKSSTIPIDALPDWFYEVREFRYLSAAESNGAFTGTQQRADGFVDSMYRMVIEWSLITMSQTAKDGNRNQFYGMTFNLHDATTPGSKRPSGEYKAPEGFVKGQSNGNPVTPMEKVYVLTQNYAQNWVLAPSVTAGVRRSGEVSGRICPFFLGVKAGKAMVFSGDMFGEMDDIIDFTCEDEGIEICDRMGYDKTDVVEYFNMINNGES